MNRHRGTGVVTVRFTLRREVQPIFESVWIQGNGQTRLRLARGGVGALQGSAIELAEPIMELGIGGVERQPMPNRRNVSR